MGEASRPGWRTVQVWVGNSTLDGSNSIDWLRARARARARGTSAAKAAPFAGSQVGQDALVLDMLGHKRGGFFVDAAANDATLGSNSWVLEREYEWNGLCIEANPRYFFDLARRRCTLVAAVLGGTDNEIVSFASRRDHPSLSQIADRRGHVAGVSDVQQLPAVPLASVLRGVGAPRTIDYLSLDLEGAEEAALRNFPWQSYQFLTLTVERPPEALQRALWAAGYVFVRSNSEFDDYAYAHESLPTIARALRRHRNLTRDALLHGHVPLAASLPLPVGVRVQLGGAPWPGLLAANK